MKHFLVTPSEAHLASCEKVYLAYRIRDGHLFRGTISSETRGGWMAILSIETDDFHQCIQEEILSECQMFAYDAVLFLGHFSPSQKLIEFWRKLKNYLLRHDIPLILPLSVSPYCQGTKFHLTSAVSGGSLRGYLEELSRVYGADALVVEHRVSRRKFNMPAHDGNGIQITEQELNTLLSQPDIQPFYSPELCMNYCTYRSKDGDHFVLFDDTRSLSAKENTCEALGIKHQLYLFSEIKNLHPPLCF